MTIVYQGVAGVEDTGNQAMATLYQQWYNAVVTGLRLDPNTFQLLQPNSPLGATSDQLWAYYNSIPPKSLLNNFQLNGMNRLYDDYRAVVNMLSSQTGDAFRQDLGDYYQPWMTYVATISPPPKPRALPEVFFDWASINAPGVAAKGRNDLTAMLTDPIALAQQMVLNRSGFLHDTPDFSRTIQDLRDAITQAPSGSFTFDSATQSSDTSHAWAQAAVGGFWDFFEGKGAGDWSQTETKASSSHVAMSVSFDHVLKFGAVPGAWYNSAALGDAHATPDNTMWKHGTPNWDSTFGPTGNMQRFLTELVVVDGITTTMTSQATYSSSEQQSIRAAAEVGFFPFFFSRASGGVDTSISFESSGAMTATTNNPAGNPVVLGATVSPASSLLTTE